MTQLIDADELLEAIDQEFRLKNGNMQMRSLNGDYSGAEIMRGEISGLLLVKKIVNARVLHQPNSGKQPKPNKLDDVNDVDKLLQLAVDTGLQPGVIYKAPAEWKQPNKLDEMIDYHEGEDMAGNKVPIYPIFREINRQLKELRGERD
jgi:hypothetical protein